MMNEAPDIKIHDLKRRRASERVNATRFSTLLNGFENSSSLDDIEHYRENLQQTLDRLNSLDDAFMTFHATISARKLYRPVKNMLRRRNEQTRRLLDVWRTICPIPLHDCI